MSKYIEADALLKSLDKGLWGKDWDRALTGALVKDAPAIDLIRCKDCVHCEKKRTANILPSWYCLRNDCSVTDNDYCSWGETKDGDNK